MKVEVHNNGCQSICVLSTEYGGRAVPYKPYKEAMTLSYLQWELLKCQDE